MRERAKNVLALAVSLLLALGTAELFTRLFFSDVEPNLQTDPVLNHTWKPNYTIQFPGWTAAAIPPYVHKTNAQGWIHDSDVSQEKPPGVFRIFYVGDSFTEGTCVSEKSLPGIVATTLQEKGASVGQRFEVINTGTQSYSPILHYLLSKHSLLKFSPDLILINVDMTDVFDDFLYKQSLISEGDGSPLACPPGRGFKSAYVRTAFGLREKFFFESVLDWFGNYSRMAERLAYGVRPYYNAPEYTVPDIPKTFDWASNPSLESIRPHVEYSMDILEKLVVLLRSQGVRVAVTAVPHKEQFTGEWSTQPFEDVRSTCARNSIPYLDTFEKLKSSAALKGVTALYIPDDMHFNELGYAKWAEAYLDFLLDPKNALLPEGIYKKN